ncbi:zwei Ig domain protein zig-8-like [Bacillus rossius redtenbacheri]|uniref:zwei Ig domain protein zig-8-like n=1 Tax=Bacillus rossius redtenbacheri TaxID=93214 RepID=UPI002FDEACB7
MSRLALLATALRLVSCAVTTDLSHAVEEWTPRWTSESPPTPTEPATRSPTPAATPAAAAAPRGRTDSPLLGHIFDTHAARDKHHHHHDPRWGPHFEAGGAPLADITVQAGGSAELDCRISLLQDKTVSWVRRRPGGAQDQLELLTVGAHTYSGDPRYSVRFQYPNNWRLRLDRARKKDEGVYECQISTHPPLASATHLHVNAPEVWIVDEQGEALQEKYYEQDSTIQLDCIVRHAAMTASVVSWLHGDRPLNYDTTRGGISVKTSLHEEGANSSLSIARVNKSDSGNYSCSISATDFATVSVHVLTGFCSLV